jgi:hypothetical protein
MSDAKVSRFRKVVCPVLYILGILLLMGFLTSCGGGSGSSTPPPQSVVVTILTPPASQSVIAGQPAQFSVSAEATGNATLSYQWMETPPGSGSATTMAGTDSPNFEINSTTTAMSGTKVSVVVSATGDPTQSQPATLTVQAAPTNPDPGNGDATPPVAVQIQSSYCLGTSTAYCTSPSTTTINNNAGDSLYVFAIVNYFGTITTQQTPTVVDTNGTPQLSPGTLDMSGTVSPCFPLPQNTAYLAGGWCIVIYSELNAASGQHAFSISQPPTDFARYDLVAVEIHGQTKGIDASFVSAAGSGSPVNDTVTFSPGIATNLANELVIAVSFSPAGGPTT